MTTPSGVRDTFVYNGLGLRVGKTDSTGSYSYLCDGASPASPVLWDGHAIYTPGLSENRGGASGYYANDRLGNLWTVDSDSGGGAGKSQLTYEDTSGFGTPLSGGRGATPFGFGGGNGCQTDGDIGLVLMGHRYYDTRIGRFISQDPAGDGDNWYAYCDNDPVNAVDPLGLSMQMPATDQTIGHQQFMDFVGAIEEGGQAAEQAWAAQNAATDRNYNLYQAAEAAKAAASQRHRYYHQWLNAPGTVWNNSSFLIPIMFDHDVGKSKVFYEMFLPPHTYTSGEDIDFVFHANDPKSAGGYDWRHILGDTNVVVTDSGKGNINISGLYTEGIFRGYPYGVRPLPVSGNVSIDIYTIPTHPVIPPALIGPIP